MVDANLNKKYKLESSQNYDEFLKAIGVGMMSRKVHISASPVVELSKAGHEYTLTSVSTMKNYILTFKDGVEADIDTAYGKQVKSILTIDGNILKEVQKTDEGKEVIIEREFGNEELKVTMIADDVKAVQVFKLFSA